MGKTVCFARDYPGFIVNRLLMPMINEAFYALLEGVGMAEDIDTGMKLGTNQARSVQNCFVLYCTPLYCTVLEGVATAEDNDTSMKLGTNQASSVLYCSVLWFTD